MNFSLEARCARSLAAAKQGDTVLLILRDNLEEMTKAVGLLGRNAATVHALNPLGQFSNGGHVEAYVVICAPGEARGLLCPQPERRAPRRGR